MEELERVQPQARKEGLVVQEMPEEVLVYDLDRHEAHCLNSAAVGVWRACDGERTPVEIARHLTRETGTPVDEHTVLFALGQLSKYNLLVEKVAVPAGISRRDFLRRAGIAAAVTVPLVISIATPTAAQAASLGGNGAPCSTGADCRSGVCSGGVCIGG